MEPGRVRLSLSGNTLAHKSLHSLTVSLYIWVCYARLMVYCKCFSLQPLHSLISLLIYFVCYFVVVVNCARLILAVMPPKKLGSFSKAKQAFLSWREFLGTVGAYSPTFSVDCRNCWLLPYVACRFAGSSARVVPAFEQDVFLIFCQKYVSASVVCVYVCVCFLRLYFRLHVTRLVAPLIFVCFLCVCCACNGFYVQRFPFVDVRCLISVATHSCFSFSLLLRYALCFRRWLLFVGFPFQRWHNCQR